MTINERNEMFREFFESECLGTMTAKGGDYAGDDDANLNFKKAAAAFGISKYQAWGVYDYKHVEAVNNAIKRNPHRPERLAESLRESIKDRINYLGILLSMLEEDAYSIKNLELGIKNEGSGEEQSAVSDQRSGGGNGEEGDQQQVQNTKCELEPCL